MSHGISWDIEILKPANQSGMTGNETLLFSKSVGPMLCHAFRDSFGRYRIIGTIDGIAIAGVISFPCKGKRVEIQYRYTKPEYRGNAATKLLINIARENGITLIPSQWQSEHGKACYK